MIYQIFLQDIVYCNNYFYLSTKNIAKYNILQKF
jgi:hypothetical protein